MQGRTLQAVLTLSERALSSPWDYHQDFSSANVVLVFVDSPEGAQFWENDLPNHPSACFVACSAGNSLDTPWKLDIAINSLPSRKALVELLNALSTHLANPPAALPAPPKPADSPPESLDASAGEARSAATAADESLPPPTPANVAAHTGRPAFDPARHLLGLLQKTIASSVDSIFVLPGQTWLLASPKTQRYYSASPVDKLQTLLQANVDDILSRPLPVEKMLESALSQGIRHHPLAELLWQAALASSGERLLSGRSPQDVVRLKHWPQVTHLPSFREFLRIAAFMNNNAASLEDIAQHTGMRIEKVFDFHNACEALGLLERHQQPAESAKSTACLPKRELYHKISSRLSRPLPTP